MSFRNLVDLLAVLIETPATMERDRVIKLTLKKLEAILG